MSSDDRRKQSSGAKSAADGLPFADIDPAQMGSAYSQAMLELQREWLVGMGKLQHDYMGFLGERMRKDVEVAKRMAECRDANAAMELQTEFAETAREDYIEVAQKLLEMSRGMADSCIERLTDVPTGSSNKGSAT